jgi:hypothetical protein
MCSERVENREKIIVSSEKGDPNKPPCSFFKDVIARAVFFRVCTRAYLFEGVVR